MDFPVRAHLLQTVRHICVQHGFDREAFLCLMEAIYGQPIGCPEQASQYHLHQFLLASLKWACPPDTPVMALRRASARRSWSESAEESLSAAA